MGKKGELGSYPSQFMPQPPNLQVHKALLCYHNLGRDKEHVIDPLLGPSICSISLSDWPTPVNSHTKKKPNTALIVEFLKPLGFHVLPPCLYIYIYIHTFLVQCSRCKVSKSRYNGFICCNVYVQAENNSESTWIMDLWFNGFFLYWYVVYLLRIYKENKPVFLALVKCWR